MEVIHLLFVKENKTAK